MDPQTNSMTEVQPVPSPLPPEIAQPQPIQTVVPVQPQMATAITPTAIVDQNLPVVEKQTKWFVRPEFLGALRHGVFRLGFASIFLVNAIYAAFHPHDFTSLLNANLIARLLGHADFMVKIAMVNDLLIGIFILLNRHKKVVYTWAGCWLLLVAMLKLMNLVF